MFQGLLTTLKSMFEKAPTIQYPEEKRPVRTRFRGRHVLKRYDNGLEKCIGCALCAAACPADAIFVEASENTDEERYSPGERYASTYEINMLRCIFCGFCEDACPTEAIVLGLTSCSIEEISGALGISPKLCFRFLTETDFENATAILRTHPETGPMTRDGDILEAVFDGTDQSAAAIIRHLSAAGVNIVSAYKTAKSLEQVFLEVVSK